MTDRTPARPGDTCVVRPGRAHEDQEVHGTVATLVQEKRVYGGWLVDVEGVGLGGFAYAEIDWLRPPVYTKP